MESGWLGILKASAWQLLGLSFALGGFWLLLRFDVLPNSDAPLVVYGLPLAILITGGLGLASLIEQIVNWATDKLKKYRERKDLRKKIAEHQRKFSEHIPYMTQNELAIYGYLITKKQKSFTAEQDCGHASSLWKRDFIQSDAMYGVGYGTSEFPFSVPDHIWTVLEEKRSLFPKEFPDRKLPWFRSRF